MADVTCLKGTVHKGNPCWSLTTDDGKKVYLVGDLSAIHDGDTVYVCGTPAVAEFCGKGKALAVTFISKDVGGKDALPEIVERNIVVSITRSSADDQPEFRMEGRVFSLEASGHDWRGSFERVQVEGKLEIFFSSEAWPKQVFVASIVATDPADPFNPKKKWSQSYQVLSDKGHAVIHEQMDVGAADNAKEEIA